MNDWPSRCARVDDLTFAFSIVYRVFDDLKAADSSDSEGEKMRFMIRYDHMLQDEGPYLPVSPWRASGYQCPPETRYRDMKVVGGVKKAVFPCCAWAHNLSISQRSPVSWLNRKHLVAAIRRGKDGRPRFTSATCSEVQGYVFLSLRGNLADIISVRNKTWVPGCREKRRRRFSHDARVASRGAGTCAFEGWENRRSSQAIA